MNIYIYIYKKKKERSWGEGGSGGEGGDLFPRTEKTKVRASSRRLYFIHISLILPLPVGHMQRHTCEANEDTKNWCHRFFVLLSYTCSAGGRKRTYNVKEGSQFSLLA